MTLNKSQREQLEQIVAKMRDRVENDIEYQIKQIYGLDQKDEIPDALDREEREIRKQLAEAIEREAIDGHDWEKALELYTKGTGFTVVNRLAAFRCMEIRDLSIPNFEYGDRSVTQLRKDGRTPASDPLIEEFVVDSREEGILEAYRRACDGMREEIEIIFDTRGPYSIIDPDFSAFEDLLYLLDDIDKEIWGASDVLGWIYEYYNLPEVESVRKKANRYKITAEEVPVANQFYTPEWVVKALTDNTLGKMYLEYQGTLEDTISKLAKLPPEKRKSSSTPLDPNTTVSDFCTYLAPGAEGSTTDFSNPSKIKIIDPACGSGHFLLYAFDILEIIWREKRPDLDPEDIPEKILEHNLFGIDVDLRACQLSAFNLYLKSRLRVEQEGGVEYEFPRINIVCADTHIANFEQFDDVIDGIKPSNRARDALENVLESFQDVHGVGSLLDVKGVFSESLEEPQLKLSEDWGSIEDMRTLFENVRSQIDENREDDGFQSRDLQSFIHLLLVLSEDYDVVLMNPPYGTAQRMPAEVENYVKANYHYGTEYYINFIEQSLNLLKDEGRIGALIPRTFMNKKRFERFREDFLESLGNFDFLAEFGLGILDNATVRTVGIVLRNTDKSTQQGTFIRLHDVDANDKEDVFISSISGGEESSAITRTYHVDMDEFSKVPGSPLSYWTPESFRDLFQKGHPLDPSTFHGKGEGAAHVLNGLFTGDNARFFRYHWEIFGDQDYIPIAKGGEDAWVAPLIHYMVDWRKDGKILDRYWGSTLPSSQFYGREGLTWTFIKEGGRRFGYLPEGGTFDQSGNAIFPKKDLEIWTLLGYLNSELCHGLMLAITPDRHWNVGEVSKIPWLEELNNSDDLLNMTKRQFHLKSSLQVMNPKSPFYIGPILYPAVLETGYAYGEHPYQEQIDMTEMLTPPIEETDSVKDAVIKTIQHRNEINEKLESLASEIDNLAYESVGIPNKHRNQNSIEIKLRSAENRPQGRDGRDLSVDEDDVDHVLRESVKELLFVLIIDILEKDDDGVILLWKESDDEESELIELLESEFIEAFENGIDRLEEVDKILGRLSNRGETYPNIKKWLKDDFFEFETDLLEGTPFIWKINSSNLIADSKEDGFACLIDYRQLDASTIDRLQSRYIDARKKHLREKLKTANQRRSDSNLSAEQRADATEEYERCQSSLRQIEEFEKAIKDLSRSQSYEWDEKIREISNALIEKVTRFRIRTKERLETLDCLVSITEEEWFQNQFSPTFLERVQANRTEWIGALNDLESACEAYSKGPRTPKEAHLSDLFTYFDEIIGSTHYGSNGIFFMNYYFSKGDEYVREDGQPKEGLADRERLLAELAAETDRDIELGEEINEACQTLAEAIPSDWETRAIEEITCSGYQPNKKHGVRINIKPLADAGIVPEIVEEKVL